MQIEQIRTHFEQPQIRFRTKWKIWMLFEPKHKNFKCLIKIEGTLLKIFIFKRLMSIPSPLKQYHFHAILIWWHSPFKQRFFKWSRKFSVSSCAHSYCAQSTRMGNETVLILQVRKTKLNIFIECREWNCMLYVFVNCVGCETIVQDLYLHLCWTCRLQIAENETSMQIGWKRGIIRIRISGQVWIYPPNWLRPCGMVCWNPIFSKSLMQVYI